MRTKAFLCAAALAAGFATSAVAQSNVYSLNVVGYYNVPVSPNQFYLVGNQLNTTNNTLPGIIPNPPPGSQFQVFANGGFTAYTFDEFDMSWAPNGNDVSFPPGLGGYFRSPKNTTLTFLGEVLQGRLTNTLIKGQIALRASMIPRADTPTGMGIPVEPGDQIQIFNNGFTAFTFDEFDLIWVPGNPNGPTMNVGQAFFYRKAPTATQTNWVINFTVQ